MGWTKTKQMLFKLRMSIKGGTFCAPLSATWLDRYDVTACIVTSERVPMMQSIADAQTDVLPHSKYALFFLCFDTDSKISYTTYSVHIMYISYVRRFKSRTLVELSK